MSEREKVLGTSSPQFENYLAVSHGGEQMPSQCHTMVQGEDNSATTTTGIPTNSSDQITVNDLLCSICKELLCRPVVLNCGHGKHHKLQSQSWPSQPIYLKNEPTKVKVML